jgi:alpha-L-rhamnosidase
MGSYFGWRTPIYLAFSILCLIYSNPTKPQGTQSTSIWNAYWIAASGSEPVDYGVYLFRKSIDLTTRPDRYIIHISADNIFELYVNGELAGRGPSKGDVAHWKYSTLDLASFLHHGINTIAIKIHNGGAFKPENQVSLRTAVIVQGNGAAEAAINTNQSWKSCTDSSYQPLLPNLVHAYYVSGPGELMDHRKTPGDWKKSAYDDSKWTNSSEISHGLPKGVFDFSVDWMLVEDKLPAMKSVYQRLEKTRSASNITLPSSFPKTKEPITIEANKKVSILLDQQFLVSAYPVLVFSKGLGAGLSMSYAESLYEIEPGEKDWKNQRHKGNRNEINNKFFCGVKDSVISNGQVLQLYSPMLYRTYRYLQLNIQTGSEPLVLEDIYGMCTGFPFKLLASVNATDTISRIFETGWRTASLCAVDTYMDCPYYERLQYIGDARIQALISLYNTGDDRLLKNALEQMDYSRMAEGITLSRYPTAHPQQIPPFSLWWIGMLHDYWQYGKDPSIIKQYLPGMRQVLSFFERYQNQQGSLQQLPYWNFADWIESEGWKNGMAPVGEKGFSSILDMQLLWAYQLAAQLEKEEGMIAMADLYTSRAIQLKKNIRNLYFDGKRKLLADTEEKNTFSQHANALGILTDVFDEAEQANAAQSLLIDQGMTQATIYFRYYVDMALRKSGAGNEYIKRLSLWTSQLNAGLSTFAEITDVDLARSDCHAWSASPNIELFRTVLGIDSDAKGFTEVVIKPHLGYLKKISGQMPHPLGLIKADYEQLANGKWKMIIELPTGLRGKLIFNNKITPLKEGVNQF